MDGFAKANQTGFALSQALKTARVDIHGAYRVERVEPEDNGYAVIGRGEVVRARRLVLAGGVWLEEMLNWLAVRIPIKTLVNQLAVTERIEPVMRTVIGIASGLLSLKQFDNGTVVIGGGWQGKGSRTTGSDPGNAGKSDWQCSSGRACDPQSGAYPFWFGHGVDSKRKRLMPCRLSVRCLALTTRF